MTYSRRAATMHRSLKYVIRDIHSVVSTKIQHGPQHIQVEDWPKFRDGQFLLQVFNGRAIADIFVILGIGCHPRLLTTCFSWRLTQT